MWAMDPMPCWPHIARLRHFSTESALARTQCALPRLSRITVARVQSLCAQRHLLARTSFSNVPLRVLLRVLSPLPYPPPRLLIRDSLRTFCRLQLHTRVAQSSCVTFAHVR
jgi:hypothetical protein